MRSMDLNATFIQKPGYSAVLLDTREFNHMPQVTSFPRPKLVLQDMTKVVDKPVHIV